MAYNWSIIEEGSTIDAADLDSRFTGVANEINDLPELSVQPNSLHYKHLPSMVVAVARQEIGDTQHVYQNIYPGYDNDAMAPTYTSLTPGWFVVSEHPIYGGGGPTVDLQALHSSTPVDVSANARAVAYIILGNIQMSNLRDKSVSGNSDVSPGVHSAHRVDHYGIFKIQVQTGVGVTGWQGVRISERYAVSETNNGRNASLVNGSYNEANHGLNNCPPYKNIPLWTRVTAAQLRAMGATEVTGARVVCSIMNRRGSRFIGGAYNFDTELTLHRCNLSVFAIYSPVTET